MDDRISHTIGGTSLQLDTSEKTVAVESHGNNIVVSRAKVVLDIIQKPINPLCKKGHNAVIFDDSRTFLLEWKTRMEAQREEARIREERFIKSTEDFKMEMMQQTEKTHKMVKQLMEMMKQKQA